MFNGESVGMGKCLALKTMTVSKSSSKQSSGLFGMWHSLQTCITIP
jgi:hypothetical protein